MLVRVVDLERSARIFDHEEGVRDTESVSIDTVFCAHTRELSLSPSDPLGRHRQQPRVHKVATAQWATCCMSLALAFALTACSRSGGVTDKSASVAQPANGGPAAAAATDLPLLISPEDVLTVRSSTVASGPAISGSVQPERYADLRAEVPAVVLQVLKDNGDPVRRGDLLVRLDDTAIRDSLNSAEASARAAEQAYAQAERQLQRLSQLRESGVVSVQALEDVEIRRNNAHSDFEAAKSRAALARQQLQRTEAHAPFDGIISDRRVSAGDTAQIGKELLKVIDPRSMRFQGMVSANHIGSVRAGQRVVFNVHGYGDRSFAGKITRVNPAANTITRQVEVLVEFTDGQPPTVAGLYAEGRVETTGTQNLTIPASALVHDGNQAFAWRLQNDALQRVSIAIGDRDTRSGEFLLRSGLAEGDRLLRYPTSTLKEGSRVETAPAADALTGST
jgi:membrane fusion protein, multidrug efflux system